MTALSPPRGVVALAGRFRRPERRRGRGGEPARRPDPGRLPPSPARAGSVWDPVRARPASCSYTNPMDNPYCSCKPTGWRVRAHSCQPLWIIPTVATRRVARLHRLITTVA